MTLLKKVTILVVEDDPNMGFLLKELLQSSGFDVRLSMNGDDGWRVFKEGNIDFCLFDVMLPGIDGFTLAKRVRETDQAVPIVFLTARSMKPDKIKGFSTGGDDYITKPFDEEELVCRVNAILSRAAMRGETPGGEATPFTGFKIGKFIFEADNLRLSMGDFSARLTSRECEILTMLCLNMNKIVRRGDLLHSIWGKDDYFNGRSLDVFITRLRKRLAGDEAVRIESIPKVGYLLHDKPVN